MKLQSGFTLIELMIVVVIIAVLTAIAYPSYTNQVQQTRRADCAGGLVGLANAMERYFTENNTYVGATLAGANAIYPATCPVDGGNATYNLAIAGTTATTYLVTATPVGAQAADNCGVLSLTQTGAKGAAGGTVDQCWR